ncbi:MAG TPA: hypothetical protein VGM51_09180 [Armatimonadota bacterium]|jgi:hypothetical protein
MNGLKKRVWVCVVVAGTALAAVTLVCGGTFVAAAPPPNWSVFGALLLGRDELPWDCMLDAVESGSTVHSACFASLPATQVVHEGWRTVPASNGRAENQIQISIACASTREDAVSGVEAELKTVPAIIPEVTGEPYLLPFADRAWTKHSASNVATEKFARVLFVRGTIAVSVSVYSGKGFAGRYAVELSTRLGTRIDRYSSNKQLPCGEFPVSAADMACNPFVTWQATHVPAPSGTVGAAIAMKAGNGLPRLVAAFKTGSGELIVPLRQLLGVAQPGTYVKTGVGRVSFTAAGKAVVLGATRAGTVDGAAVNLRAAPILQGKELIVPVTMLEDVLGRKVTWSTLNKMPLAKM